MNFSKKIKFQLLMQNSFFVLVFIALIILLGFLSKQFVFTADITQSNKSVLSKGSVEILKNLDGPINLTVFATNDNVSQNDTFRQSMLNFIGKYQREKKDVYIKFINPTEEPKLAQELGIRSDGEVIVEYKKRTEHIVPPFAEQDLTNLLVRLSRTNEKPVMYLDGHGEKNLMGLKNNDLGEFGKQLENRGFKFSNPDLTVLNEVPKEGSMLVIASPQVPVTKVEAQKILNYLNNGGNLLWLLDDSDLQGLDEVAKYIGLTVSQSKVVDPGSLQFGGNEDMTFALAYGNHPITERFMLRTQYLDAYEVNAIGTFENGWEVTNLIEVGATGWLASPDKKSNNKLTFDPDKDKAGPINIAVALNRKYGDKGQRVLVVGNASFLSNNFITSGGNLDLGVNMVNWLAGDDKLITIQPTPLKDVNVTIPSDAKSVFVAWTVFHAFQYFFPVGLFLLGFWIWFRRRKA
ncbi:MAG: DUF4350 domain-containing protein [Methylophilaceae bacterium]